MGKNFDLKGELTLNEQDLLLLPPENVTLGFSTKMHLFPHLSVGENLAFGLKDKSKTRKGRAEIDKALWQAGLTAFMIVTRLPFLEVSGLVQR